MKCFILGAGKGKRLQPLSNELPAPMFPVLNKPLLLYIIEHLKKFHITDIRINLHHLPEYIDSYFEDGQNFDANISYSLEKDLLGTAGALKRTETFFGSTFIVHAGNSLTEIDLNELIYFHNQNHSKLTLAVHTDYERYQCTELSIDDKGKIVKSNLRQTKTDSKFDLIPSGVYVFEKETLDVIPTRQVCDIETDLLNLLLSQNTPAYAFIVKTGCYRVQYPKDLLKLNLKLLNDFSLDQNQLIHFSDSVQIHKSVIPKTFHPLFIGENSLIGKNVEFLGQAVIGSNVKIDEGAVISNAVIFNNTYIGKNIEINNSIVFQNLHINTRSDFSIYVNDEFIIDRYKVSNFANSFSRILFRTIDIVFSSVALIILSPVFFLIVIFIKLDSKGPAFFISRRMQQPEIIQKSKNWYRFQPEKIVKYFKFRTMIYSRENEETGLDEKNIYEYGPFFKAKDDPRITRVGKFLRKTSLDELPLLINVLRGDLKLVGIWGLPEKEAIGIQTKGVSNKDFDISETARIRFKGELGLAGYWQARGRSELSTEERILHDSIQSISDIDDELLLKHLGEYKKSRSVKGYISLILDTVKSVIRKKGAF